MKYMTLCNLAEKTAFIPNKVVTVFIGSIEDVRLIVGLVETILRT